MRNFAPLFALTLAFALPGCVPPSDAEIAADIEEGMMSAPGADISFSVMKREFPKDYQQLVNRMVPLAREGAGEEEVRALVLPYLTSFLARIGPDVARAPGAELRAFRDVQLDLLKMLKRQSATLCAEMFVEGRLSSGKPGTVQRNVIARSQAAFMTAAAAARRNPVERARPGQADYSAMYDQLIAHGLSDRDIELLDQTSLLQAADDETICRIGIATYEALIALPDAASERMTVLLVIPGG